MVKWGVVWLFNFIIVLVNKLVCVKLFIVGKLVVNIKY